MQTTPAKIRAEARPRTAEGRGARTAPRTEAHPALDPISPLAGLQKSAGNRAVQRAVSLAGPQAPSTGRSVGRPPVLQRLWTKEEFRTETNAGFLTGRGKTLKQLESLLDEYHEIRAKGGQLQPGPKQDRAINILSEIREDVNLWMSSHEGDTSRSKNRIPGLQRLFLDAGKELNELKKIRDAGRDFMGEEKAPVERTENTFKTQMEGSVSSVLSRLGPIVGATAPNPGDTSELEVGVKVPVDPSGVGYIGFRFAASAARLKGRAMRVELEVAVTGGGQLPGGVDIGGELGMYLEAQGATPEKAMELVSYGMYRRVRESKVIPNEVANFIWGGSATAVGWNRAEKWAAGVEKENFKDKALNLGGAGDSDEEDAYVETGALAGLQAQGGVGGVASLEGSAQYKTGTKYDRESVKALKTAGLGKAAKAPTRRGQTNIIGESTHHLEFAFGASGGPFAGGLSIALDWVTEKRKGMAKLQSLEVGLEASASVPMSELVMQGIGGAIPPLVSNLVMAMRKAGKSAATDKSTRSDDVGSLLSATENGATSVLQLAQVPSEVWKPTFSTGGPPELFSAPAELKISVSGGYDFSTGEFRFEAKLEYIKGIEVNAGVFSVKVKQGQTLVRVYYAGGKWAWD